MNIYDPPRWLRVAYGVAGFLVFLGTAPCVLYFLRESYVTGWADRTGVIGLIGMILMVGFVGFFLLYQAFRRPNERFAKKDEDG